MGRAMRQGLRRLVIWAMLSPFLALSCLSSGVMPARAADGSIELVLCSGAGPALMRIDLATGQPVTDDAPDSNAADRCDWACAQCAPGLSPHIALPAPPAAPGRRLALFVQNPALLAARATGLPPATGPPAGL